MKYYFNNSNTGGYPKEMTLIYSELYAMRMLAKLIQTGAKHLHLNYFYDNENISINVADRP